MNRESVRLENVVRLRRCHQHSRIGRFLDRAGHHFGSDGTQRKAATQLFRLVERSCHDDHRMGHLVLPRSSFNQKWKMSSKTFVHIFRLSPVGVLFLVASKMLEMESWEVMLGQLGMYFLTVMVGLFIHGFVVLQLIYFVVTRKLPFRYVGNLSEALATAFATSSR